MDGSEVQHQEHKATSFLSREAPTSAKWKHFWRMLTQSQLSSFELELLVFPLSRKDFSYSRAACCMQELRTDRPHAGGAAGRLTRLPPRCTFQTRGNQKRFKTGWEINQPFYCKSMPEVWLCGFSMKSQKDVELITWSWFLNVGSWVSH